MNAFVPRAVAALGVVLALLSLALPWGSLAEGDLRYDATGFSQNGRACDWFVGHGQKSLCSGTTNLAARAGLVLAAPMLALAAAVGAWGVWRPARVRLLVAGIVALTAAFLLRTTLTSAMLAAAQRSITTDSVGLFAAIGAGALLGLAGALAAESRAA